MTDLKSATTERKRLLRAGLTQARVDTEAVRRSIRALIDDGEPENGLLDALTAAVREMEKVEGILQRAEQHQFAGRQPMQEAKPVESVEEWAPKPRIYGNTRGT